MSEKKSIYDRIAEINLAVPFIPATSYNENTGKYYRSKDDYIKALSRPIANAGLVLSKEIISFEEAPVNIGSKTAYRATLAARYWLRCDGGEISTDVIVTKNDFYDAGYLSCMSLATARALEDFFPKLREPLEDPTYGITEDLVKEIYTAEKGDLMKIAKTNLSLVNNAYFQKLMKARETILKLSVANQATIKKGSEVEPSSGEKEAAENDYPGSTRR